MIIQQMIRIITQWQRAIAFEFPLNQLVFIIKLYRHISLFHARSIGMYVTKGQFISFQIENDFSHPEHILKQVNLLNGE